MRIYFTLALILFCLSSNTLQAQIGNPARADSVALQEQFDDMLEVSNRFQTYKVVQEPFLRAFMSNVSDSISIYTEEIGNLNATIATQAGKIQEQATNITERDGTISTLENEKESINLLGIPLSKSTYTTTMYVTLGVLLAALLLALGRMRYAAGTANEANQKVAKLSEELETSKRRRLEIEQNLRRQLQDEINKRPRG